MAQTTNPLKIFILAGQSNMEGQGEMTSGAMGNLKYLVDHDTAKTYAHLVDGAGAWLTRNDVWIYYKRGGTTDVYGGLKAGYGVSATTIGPELQFGFLMGDHFNNQVLLIKTAWGGKALATDFRPPHAVGINGYHKRPIADGDTGFYFMEILKIVRAVTGNIKTYFPTYDGKGYEIAGFAWHQGWNDRIDSARAAEYESNLKWFIKDIRDSLKTPLLPFATANMGAVGWTESFPPALAYFAGMKAVTDPTKYPEFGGNVAYVETRDYWRAKEISPADQLYHWNRNAESYYLVGKGLGDAMLKMLPTITGINSQSEKADSKATKASSRYSSNKVVLEYKPRGSLKSRKSIALDANGKAVAQPVRKLVR